jgi:hypothetical protein
MGIEILRGDLNTLYEKQRPIEGEVAIMDRIGTGSLDLRSEHRIGCNRIGSSRATFESAQGWNIERLKEQRPLKSDSLWPEWHLESDESGETGNELMYRDLNGS